MQIKRWIISLSNKKEYVVDEEVKDNLIAVIGDGSRLISIGDVFINPAYIVSIEKSEDYSYTESTHQLEAGSQQQTPEEFEKAQKRAMEIREHIERNVIGSKW